MLGQLCIIIQIVQDMKYGCVLSKYMGNVYIMRKIQFINQSSNIMVVFMQLVYYKLWHIFVSVNYLNI